MHALIELVPAREYNCHLWLSRNDDHPSPIYDIGWEVRITEEGKETRSKRFLVTELARAREEQENRAAAEDHCLSLGSDLEQHGYKVELKA